jgi:hypothetical protein
MAGRAREGRRSWWIGGSKAGAVDIENDDDNGGGGGGGGGCWGGYRRGRGFSRGNREDPITLLVKAFRSNLESSIIVSVKIEVYISWIYLYFR